MANSRKKPRLDLLGRAGQSLVRLLSLSPAIQLCVGFSGGLDSVVLLHLLACLRESYGFKLSAVHVHHGLSPNADAWADFALTTAASLGVPCKVERVAITQESKLGLEAAARCARYAVFEQQTCDALLLAHHSNDQAETVLLNLLRGSGLMGLAAMPYARRLDNGAQLVRPLLDETRQTLLEYAQTHALTWIEDESNANPDFDRNFLRLNILPKVTEVFPGVCDTLSRVAEHAAEGVQLLAELAALDFADCVVDGAFDLVRAKVLSLVRRRNVLRHWLAQRGIVLETRTFDSLLCMMESARDDAKPMLVWQGQAIRRYRSRLYITQTSFKPGSVVSVSWAEGRPTPVPEWCGRLCWQPVMQGGLPEEVLHSSVLELRPRTGGERLRLHRNGANRQIKHLWQESGTPPWLRESTPLLWIDGQLAAVPGLGVAGNISGQGWQVSWLPD